MSEGRQALTFVYPDIVLLPCLIEWVKYCPFMSSVGMKGRRLLKTSALQGLRAVEDGMGSQKLSESPGPHKL